MKTHGKWRIIKRIKSLIQYTFDPKIPFYKKLLIILGFIYLLFPMDIIPDPILGFGIVDDMTLIILILNIFQGELDKYEEKNRTRKADQDIIENFDYQFKDQDKEGRK